MSANTQSVLLVSTGRTGTKFFARLLGDLFPQVEAHHDTPYSTLINILTNTQLAGLLPRQAPIYAWKKLKKRQVEQCTRPFFFDSNNHLYALVVLAPELYANLRVIHIIRDPRTYVRSHLNWARHRLKSFIANYLLPFWQPNPFLMGEMSPRQWLSLDKFGSFCWVWDFKNRYIESLAQTDIPYLRMRFEDFFAGPEPQAYLEQMLEFIGLPPVGDVTARFKQPVNASLKGSFPDWRNWEPAMCAVLDSFCGELMSSYGYGRETEWLEKVRAGKQTL